MGYIAQAKARSIDAELHWLVTQMILPELPQLAEALRVCLNLLLYNSPVHPDDAPNCGRGPGVTLPVSLGQLDALKGILVRDGAYVTHMDVHLRERHFNRTVHRLVLRAPFLLPQILTAKRSIDRALALLAQAAAGLGTAASSSCGPHAHGALTAVFAALLRELQAARGSLQLPTQPALVFPAHRADPALFEPALPAHIAVDLYISQAEVCVDLKDLRAVTERPWCEIDPHSGKSYVDSVRDQMSEGKPEPAGRAQHAAAHGSGVLGGVLARFQHRLEPHEYIARCVTYAGRVVMVNKKIEVSSADPMLVSAFTKLDSVEHMVGSFLDNIRTLAGDAPHESGCAATGPRAAVLL